MDFYAELIEARQSKTPEHRLQLLDYEKRKSFELRISELEAFIREHELTTHTKRDALSGLGNKYQPQVSVQTKHWQSFHRWFVSWNNGKEVPRLDLTSSTTP